MGRESAVAPAAPSPHLQTNLPVLIEGSFTYDSLPDLFRFVCTRSGRLSVQFVTLAGIFSVYLESGRPLDIMFNPVRPVGATVGPKTFRQLFLQEGGRFRVYADPPELLRRSLHGSGEELLMEFATRQDELEQPLEDRLESEERSVEFEMVKHLPRADHKTAFQAQLTAVLLPDVLQLFSVSCQPYWIQLVSPGGALIGRIHLSARREVVRVEYGSLRSREAFTALLVHRPPALIDVRSLAVSDAAPAGTVPLGMLDALLMHELLSGRLSSLGTAVQLAAAGDAAGDVAGDVVDAVAGAVPETPPGGSRGWGAAADAEAGPVAPRRGFLGWRKDGG